MDKLLVVTTLVNGRRPSDTFEVRARGSTDKKWEAGKHRKRLFFGGLCVSFPGEGLWTSVSHSCCAGTHILSLAPRPW
jgi:hypothetical protein